MEKQQLTPAEKAALLIKLRSDIYEIMVNGARERAEARGKHAEIKLIAFCLLCLVLAFCGVSL
jgi:hypothetical protein